MPRGIMLATLTIHLRLPGCASLKEKRGHIKPLLNRLHREFNVSVAEMDLQDSCLNLSSAVRCWVQTPGFYNPPWKLSPVG